MRKVILFCIMVIILGGVVFSQTPNPTSAPPALAEVWLDIPETVAEGSDFPMKVFIDSPDSIYAAINFAVLFDDSIIEVDTSQGLYGTEEGPDGFIAAANVDNDEFRIAGFDAVGRGPGINLHFATLYFRALRGGTINIELRVDDMADVNAEPLNAIGTGGTITVSALPQEPPVILSPKSITIEFPGNTGTTTVTECYYGYSILNKPDWVTLSPPSGGSGTVITITVDWSQFEPNETKSGSVTFLNSGTTGLGFLYVAATYSILRGDVNGDGSIDIIDALLTAQYYVGLNPQNFIPGAADVDSDGSITIVDALLIAQYYVNNGWDDGALFTQISRKT
ncbi:MAG: hypothetical protein JXJ04_08655 [Spirochaetales bacterium]|nr:hypothetical protein [Spirochaetales bacterium]